MKLGWLLFQYAPPDLKLTPAQRREARRRTWHAYHSTPSSLLISLATAGVLGVLIAGTIQLLDRTPPNYFGALGFAATLVLIAATWITNAFVGRWIYAKAHRKALRDMGFDVCMQCGYWLRGLRDDAIQCPECGAQRELLPKAEIAP